MAQICIPAFTILYLNFQGEGDPSIQNLPNRALKFQAKTPETLFKSKVGALVTNEIITNLLPEDSNAALGKTARHNGYERCDQTGTTLH